MTYEKQQKIKNYAINSGLCANCLKSRSKPCIFYDNNDEHLCSHIWHNYKKNGGVK